MSKEQAQVFGKTLIKHRTSGQYYAGEGKWAPSVAQAKNFESLWLVFEESQRHDLADGLPTLA